LSGGVTAVILVTSWGGVTYAWLSTPIVGLCGAAVVLLVAFVMVERRAGESGAAAAHVSPIRCCGSTCR